MLEHVASRTSTVVQSTYTFDDVPLGVAADDRYIIVAASTARGSGSLVISDIVVAGAATQEVVAANNVRAACVIRRTSAPLTAGATGQISVTLSNTANGVHLDVWSAKRLASPVAHDTKTGIATTANTVSVSLDVPPRGVALAAAFGFRSASNDWRGSAASDNFPGGDAGQSITPTHDAAGFSWVGLTEDSDGQINSVSTAVNWMLLAAASWQMLPNERVFGAVMG